MRFLHSADWQLGMPAHFLGREARARYVEARFAAVRALGRLAGEEGCEFVVVCGDVFDSNQLSLAVVARGLEALRGCPVPVYLLPGNHDPLDAGSVYRSEEFLRRCPEQVHVIDWTGPRTVADGVELVGAPWSSKRPLTDLVGQQCAGLAAASDVVRIVAGHGAVDSVAYTGENPTTVRTDVLRASIEDGRVHYVGLGDRHSLTDLGLHGRAWYSGTPEVTDYDEQDPGNVLVVDVDRDACVVHPHRVGAWRFVERKCSLGGAEDVTALDAELSAMPDKELTAVKLVLVGTVNLREKARLDELLEEHGRLFASLRVSQRRSDLAVMPDPGDVGDLGLSGFARSALDELQALAASGSGDAAIAQDALGLLYRLAGGAR